MITYTGTQPKNTAGASSVTGHGVLLQRKCACGGSSGLSGECEECRKKKMQGIQTKLAIGEPDDAYEREADRIADQVLAMPARPAVRVAPLRIQRFARQSAGEAVPTSVDQILAGSGRPLEPALSRDMEQRFGYDFSRVRIHTGANAERSAREVDAHAYTVGRDIVFGTGRFAPETREGQRLLAHELTHVVQQSGAAGTGSGQRADRSDRLPISSLAGGTPDRLFRDPDDKGTKEAKKDDWAGKTIPKDEKQGLAISLFQDIGVAPVKSFGSVAGAKFLLHDTSGASSRAHLETEAKKARGPLGSGPNVFVPATGQEIIQRPDFYDPRRPTTTEFEKGEDLLREADRETALRKVWKATNTAAKDKALADALTGLPLSAKEVADEKKGAKDKLDATSGKIFSTGNWAVAEICRREKKEGAAAVAVKGKEADLTSGCKVIGPVLEARAQRARATVSVELVQVGVKKGAKSENTCDPSNPDILPLPDPPYSAEQYWNTTLMYLRAAVAAGVWPMTTTHFVEDAFAGGHCDPRCFDLQRFYDGIANFLAPLGHAKGSTYGVKPKYGLKSGTDTVWWHDKICHRGPP